MTPVFCCWPNSARKSAAAFDSRETWWILESSNLSRSPRQSVRSGAACWVVNLAGFRAFATSRESTSMMIFLILSCRARKALAGDPRVQRLRPRWVQCSWRNPQSNRHGYCESSILRRRWRPKPSHRCSIWGNWSEEEPNLMWVCSELANWLTSWL